MTPPLSSLKCVEIRMMDLKAKQGVVHCRATVFFGWLSIVIVTVGLDQNASLIQKLQKVDGTAKNEFRQKNMLMFFTVGSTDSKRQRCRAA